MGEKIIRDPVHDVIRFLTDDPADALLLRLLNCQEFQRLRRVRQLGLAHLAYPGADHTRYSHSLGVMETTRRIVSRLGERGGERASISLDERMLVEAAALLHDLGHGPFSHVFERVTGKHHEEITRAVILSDETEVNSILRSVSGEFPMAVAELLSGRGRKLLKDIISSQLDADRMDYLLRDDHMTGAGYGRYDLGWLLTSLCVHEDRLAISGKGVSAAEGFLQARFHMYRNVYFHKVVRSAEGMLKLALQRASRLAVQERLSWPGREHVVCRALMGMEMPLGQFVELDDVSLLQAFKAWVNGDDVVLGRLCHGLLFRKLYKTVELPMEVPAAEAAQMLAGAVEAVKAAGGDVDYDLFFDEPVSTPYETIRPEDPMGGREIRVVETSGRVRPLTEVSAFARALGSTLSFRRIHVEGRYLDAVVGAVGGR
jgi:HD superfamily phosphohydrolase